MKYRIRCMTAGLLSGLFYWAASAGAQNLYRENMDSLKFVETGRARMEVLASDSMAGRGYANDGHTKAARYVAREFMAAGLAPVKGEGERPEDYFQYFDFAVNLVEDARLVLDGDTLVIGRDFIPNGGARPADGVFKLFDAGHGLPGEWKKKAEGRFAVVREGLPEGHKLSKEEAARSAKTAVKIARAEKHGAAGVILLKKKLTFAFAAEPLALPVLEVKTAAWPAGNIKEVAVMIAAAETKIRSQNVAGMIRGTKQPDSAVVICAHYDHMGQVGDAIFYGANDNASGTSFIMGLADYYGENPPDKTLIFIAFGAEEAGLHGSVYYALHDPLYPLEKTCAALNFDLMANGAEGVMTVGGKTFSAYFARLEAINEQRSLVHPLKARENAANSDHYPFTLRNVPAFFFYTMGGPTHYHDIYDRPEAFKLDEYYDMRQLMIQYIKTL